MEHRIRPGRGGAAPGRAEAFSYAIVTDANGRRFRVSPLFDRLRRHNAAAAPTARPARAGRRGGAVPGHRGFDGCRLTPSRFYRFVPTQWG
jgi:hypothetical protein